LIAGPRPAPARVVIRSELGAGLADHTSKSKSCRPTRGPTSAVATSQNRFSTSCKCSPKLLSCFSGAPGTT